MWNIYTTYMKHILLKKIKEAVQIQKSAERPMVNATRYAAGTKLSSPGRKEATRFEQSRA
jgi:hypothetical protein